MPFDILINGGGIAGPTLAFWLTRHGHAVTIAEQARQLRSGGQAVDFRGPALTVLEKMGLLERVKAAATQMGPLVLVDGRGKEVGRLPAEVISGEEALRLGIVNRVATREDIEAAGRAWALELAALPTLAIGYMKRNLNAAETGTLPEILDIESFNMVRTMTTADHRDAAAAFVAKRKPVFQGR